MAETKTQRSGLSSVSLAALIALVIGAWLLSGQFRATASSDNTAAKASLNPDARLDETRADSTEKKPDAVFEVRTRTVSAEPRKARLIIRGQSKADARVQVRAETPGVVMTISPRKGQLVRKGELLCKIDVGARKANLLEAEAARTQAEADYKSSATLARKGHTGRLRAIAAKAKRDAARAAYERARIDLANIKVTAPFRGIIENQPVKAGDYLTQAGVCATLVRIDPLLLTGAVSERDIAKLKVGMDVTGNMITGETVAGKITYISPSSDPTTKTFLIEANVANPEQTLRAGVTTDIVIPLNATPAHRLAASSLSLNDAGEIGVRLVTADNQVRFQPVDILSNETDAVWVAGLPNNARVITVGQEYVSDGQKVQPVAEAMSTKSKPNADAAKSIPATQ